jgi:hypothetical protein
MNKRSFMIGIALSMLILVSLACAASTANFSSAKLTADSTGAGETTTFSPDQTIYCIVQLANAPSDTKVKAVWTAVNAEGAAPNTQLDSTEITSADNTLTFKLSNDKAWPAGSYKVELYLNDKLTNTLEFTVQ